MTPRMQRQRANANESLANPKETGGPVVSLAHRWRRRRREYARRAPARAGGTVGQPGVGFER